MAYDYNKLYGSTRQALGEPSQVFVDFFHKQARNDLLVLDVGCGQGRDALFIARLGHSVTGVDFSPNGIRDLIDAARQEKLSIKGVTADITTFVPAGEFDVLLIDRTLHMLPEKDRLDVLKRLISHVIVGGWALIADERSNMQMFKSAFETHEFAWKIELEVGGNLFLRRS